MRDPFRLSNPLRPFFLNPRDGLSSALASYSRQAEQPLVAAREQEPRMTQNSYHPVYPDPHCPSMDSEAATLAGGIDTFMWLLPVAFQAAKLLTTPHEGSSACRIEYTPLAGGTGISQAKPPMPTLTGPI